MFGDILQPTHLIFIMLVALVVLGPKRLPEVGKSLGKGLRDFRGAMAGIEEQTHDMFDPSTPHETPTAEAIPTAAVAPLETVDPIAAVTPLETADPTAAVAPMETVDPTEQVHPVDLVEPAERFDPVDAGEPFERVDPVDAAEPFERFDPVDAVEPFERFDPVDPVDPGTATAVSSDGPSRSGTAT